MPSALLTVRWQVRDLLLQVMPRMLKLFLWLASHGVAFWLLDWIGGDTMSNLRAKLSHTFQSLCSRLVQIDVPLQDVSQTPVHSFADEVTLVAKLPSLWPAENRSCCFPLYDCFKIGVMTYRSLRQEQSKGERIPSLIVVFRVLRFCTCRG